MRWLILLPVLPLAIAAPCRPVDRDQILAADLEPEVAAFGRLDSHVVIGLAPAPGTHRTFLARELRAIAERNGLSLDGSIPEVCFERALQPLTGDQIRAALRSALGSGDTRIELVDFSRQPMPSGELVFALSGLAPRAQGLDAPVVWRGSLRYSPQHTLTVWASVRLHQERAVVVAARAIRCGSSIGADDITVVRRDVSPLTAHLETAADALGRITRKAIPAGDVISDTILEIPLDVMAGDIVHVVAFSGDARITFDAVARSQGRKGDRILLLNPESHRSFRALVDGHGRAHTGDET